MAYFFTHVELLDGTAANYTRLHAEMEMHGFYREVRSQDGKTIYALPTGTYHRASVGTATAVRDAARLAAQATGLKSVVLRWKRHSGPDTSSRASQAGHSRQHVPGHCHNRQPSARWA